MTMVVVLVGAKCRLALGSQSANDCAGHVANANDFAHRVGAREHVTHQRCAHNANIGSAACIGLR